MFRWNSCSTVHPHVRGVYADDRTLLHNWIRFIPTCVGYTDLGYLETNGATGSSPRAWGIPAGGLPPFRRHRFIPTCVGYTRHPAEYHRRPAVHPHVRGVYCQAARDTGYMNGSSPRAWGIRLNSERSKPFGAVHPHVRGVYEWTAVAVLRSVRFIPTCVGYTDSHAGRSMPGTVHPHVRGVYST